MKQTYSDKVIPTNGVLVRVKNSNMFSGDVETSGIFRGGIIIMEFTIINSIQSPS